MVDEAVHSARRKGDSIALVLGILLLGLFLVTRSRHGLTFPIPWPDEGSFLWPALAFRDHGTLSAPELHPTREVYWMPPGYMLVAGFVFRVVPFSLDAARTLSALYLVSAFALLGVMTWRLTARFGHIALLALFLHACPVVTVVGNVARMESLVLLVATGGFALLSSGRAAGFGVLLLGPLVHPNGLFPLVGGAALWLVSRRTSFRWRRADYVLLGFACLAWAAYAIHVVQGLDAFIEDMRAQLRFKAFVSSHEGAILKRLIEPPFTFATALLIASQFPARRFGVPIRALSLLSAALLLQTLLAAGWLYEVYLAVAALIASLVALEVASVWAEQQWPGKGRPASWGIALALLAVNFGVVVKSAFVNRSLERAVVIRPAPEPSYSTDEDRAVVREFLKANTPKAGRLVAHFVPDAEALLYEDLRGPHLGFAQQTFHELPFDVSIAHESVWFPKWVLDLQMLKVHSMNRRRPRIEVLRVRDGTERWVAFDFRVVRASQP